MNLTWFLSAFSKEDLDSLNEVIEKRKAEMSAEKRRKLADNLEKIIRETIDALDSGEELYIELDNGDSLALYSEVKLIEVSSYSELGSLDRR